MSTTLRLASDSSQARQDIQEFGRVAQRELNQTGASARGLNTEFGDLAGGINQVETAATSMISGLSKAALIGSVLNSQVIGPMLGWAAAGATVALAFANINAQTAELGRSVEASGLSPELFQAIERRAVRSGVDLKEMQSGLLKARQGFYEAERSAGAFYSQLRAAAPDVLEAVNAQDTQTRKLEVFLKALEQYPNKMDRAALAQAAFGENGLKIVRVLSSQEGGLQALEQQYLATGGLLSAETIRQTQEIERAWVDMIRSISSEWDQLFARIKKAGLEVLDTYTTSPEERLENNLNRAGDIVNSRGDSLERLEADLARARAGERTQLQIFEDGLTRSRSATTAEIEKLVAREKAALAEASGAYRTALADLQAWNRENDVSVLFGPEDEESRLQDAVRAAAERAALEGEAAQLLVQQNDIVDAYAIGQSRLNKLKDAGLISSAQLSRAEVALGAALARQTPAYQARLEAEREAARAAEEYRRLQGEAGQVLIHQNDITVALRFETERVNRLKAAGLLDDKQAAAELERARQALTEMTPAFREAAEFEAFLADAAKVFAGEMKRAADEAERRARAERDARNAAAGQIIRSTESPAETRAREMAELDALLAAQARGEIDVALGPDTVQRRLAQIEESYQRATEEASRFRDTQYDIEEALWSLSDPAADFEGAWRKAARTFIEEFLGIEEMISGLGRSLRELIEGVTGGRSLGSLIGGSISGVFGFKAAEPAGPAPIIVPEFHDGGLVGQPSKFRDLSRGIAPHESLVLARKDEMIGYPGSFGGRSFAVTINAPGADAAGLASVRQEMSLLKSAFLSEKANFTPNVESSLASIAAQKGRLV